jgi:magnesium transporter
MYYFLHVATPSKGPAMVKHYRISEGRIIEAAAGCGDILVYISPDETERKHLVDDLRIDDHTLQSALDPNELGRMEFEPDHVALIVKRPKRYCAKDNFLFKTESVGLFLFAGTLIVLLTDDIPLFDGKQFTKVESLQDLILKLIYRCTWHFEEHIKVISMMSDELEQEINQSTGNRQLLNMFTLEKSLVFYLDAISSNRRVIEKIKTSAAKLALSASSLEFLDDVSIENAQCYEMAQMYSQVLSSLMDARASVISNNLNVLMKNLNALVIAVAVPSFFAGVGGMSEFSNMIGFSHWKFGYLAFTLVMCVIGVTTFYVIRKAERIWKES